MQLAHYRRFADERYYKGVEYADVIEALARRRAAEAFAANGVPAEDIWANVQPLSGAPANSAIYAALVPIGATVMGMDLLHGGHLTHGSPANRSGKLYNIVSYGIDPETERLNYDAIEALARQHKPKMIIAGYTSYPWMPDWKRFRQIADAVGAYLLADIAHTAGMVVAGVVPSPIGHAHVISCTTHKTLYGPRGACIVTSDKTLAEKIDTAVFPGEQGGPHVNAIAGMAVAFKLSHTPEFRQLQQQVVANARFLASELQRLGLRISYGGTDTHLLLVDCKSVRAASGVSPDGRKGTPLMGEIAARILDVAGIVCNRNTIPATRAPAPRAASGSARRGFPSAASETPRSRGWPRSSPACSRPASRTPTRGATARSTRRGLTSTRWRRPSATSCNWSARWTWSTTSPAAIRTTTSCTRTPRIRAANGTSSRSKASTPAASATSPSRTTPIALARAKASRPGFWSRMAG